MILRLKRGKIIELWGAKCKHGNVPEVFPSGPCPLPEVRHDPSTPPVEDVDGPIGGGIGWSGQY